MFKLLKSLRSAAACTLLSVCAAVYAISPSGTLPVIYVNTENNTPVTSKETYLTARYYLDPMGCEGVEPIGSAEAPLVTQIKGRGNYTWTGFDKKPYRLKLDSKQPLLGMKKSKHFGLLAHTDDNLGFMRNIIGFELSKRLGLAWTPEARPCELVLNGDYLGIYFLTELIRVDKDRVNIVEQADMVTDPEAITGGWLVEIDNYDTDPHVAITEGNDQPIIFTYKTPEILSAEQENYLRTQMTAINEAIYTSDKTSTEWEKYIDIDELARYYIVQEVMDDCESFHGSCYMYRDLGADNKWEFGPVWDFGNAYHRSIGKYIWQDATFNQTWIGEIYKFPRFQEKVKEIWADFVTNRSQGMKDFIISTAQSIEAAARSSYQRWPQYGNENVVDIASKAYDFYMQKTTWLGNNWGTPMPIDYSNVALYLRGDILNNWGIAHQFTYNDGDGTFSIDVTGLSGLFKIATGDWTTIDLGSNGSAVVPGEPYKLVDAGDNMALKDNQTIKTAHIAVNLQTKEMTVTDISGVGDITASESTCGFTVVGNTLMCHREVMVYTSTGVKVAEGTGEFAMQPGLYIVVENGTAHKIVLR